VRIGWQSSEPRGDRLPARWDPDCTIRVREILIPRRARERLGGDCQQPEFAAAFVRLSPAAAKFSKKLIFFQILDVDPEVGEEFGLNQDQVCADVYEEVRLSAVIERGSRRARARPRAGAGITSLDFHARRWN